MSWEKINSVKTRFGLNKNYDLQRLETFIKENDIVSFKTSTSVFAKSIQNFFKTAGEYGRNSMEIDMPYLDHCIIFKTKNKDIILTSHPYAPLDAIKQKIDNWADKNNLKAEYYSSDDSWYKSANLIAIRLDTTKE